VTRFNKKRKGGVEGEEMARLLHAGGGWVGEKNRRYTKSSLEGENRKQRKKRNFFSEKEETWRRGVPENSKDGSKGTGFDSEAPSTIKKKKGMRSLLKGEKAGRRGKKKKPTELLSTRRMTTRKV